MESRNRNLFKSALIMFATTQLFMGMLALPKAAFPSDVALEWDASNDADLAGYKVYYQANSSTVPFQGAGAAEGSAPVDVKNITTATINGLDPANTYYFAVTVYNSKGVESAYSNIIEVPESVPPVVSITSGSTGSYVSGTVPITAVASDNVGVSSVEFFVNDVLQGTAVTVPYTFNWDTSALATGDYTLTAKAHDTAGNVGISGSLAMTVAGDTAPPTVTVGAPASAVSGVVTITASATDNVGVTRVELYDDGVLVLASNQDRTSYTWNSTVSPNGLHILSAKAYDAAGNIGESANVAVMVANDSSAPTVAIASPAAGATVTGIVSVSGHASDDNGVSKVEFYINGELKATSSSAPYTFNWNTSALTNGSYTLSAKAYDAAGNAAQSAGVNVSVFNDNVAPSVSIASPVNNATAAGSVTVSMNASDNVAVSRVEFYVNGTMQGTSGSAPYNFNWNTSGLTNGSYTLSAKAYDAAGNAAQSAGVNVSVFNDNVAPTVSIASPVNNATAAGSVTVSASATDNVAVSRVEFYVNGTMQATSTSAPYSFNWNTSALANGSYTVSAKAYDAAGNVGQSSNVAVAVLNDTAAPSVKFSAPTSNKVRGNNVNIGASASDNTGITKLELYIDGSLKYTTTSSSLNIGWNFTLGVHTITVKAYDAAKNVGTVSKTVNRFL